jgi:hypothetical protein
MNNVISATASITALPPRVKDLTGRVFGLWTVEGFDSLNERGKAMFRCVCWCGKTGVIDGASLSRWHSRSCGCLRDKIVSQANTKHGKWGTDIYNIYHGIKKRTESPDHIDYPRYGGTGIGLSKEWSDSFDTFASDMGPRPSKKHTVDRSNNLLGYSKENCRWATYKEQARNRRSNRNLTYRGETLSLAAWAERYGMDDQVLGRRLKKGWPLEKSLLAVVRCYKKAPYHLRYEAEDLLTG